MKICSHIDCRVPVGRHGAKGFCMLHYRRWKKHGTTTPKQSNYKLTHLQKEQIAKRYEGGENIYALSKEFGINQSGVYKISQRRGMPLKMGGRHIIPIRGDAFSSITPESAYWIGFIMADGCVWNNIFSIGLAIKDIKHLEKFKNFIHSNHKITLTNQRCNGKTNKGCKISIKSKKIISDLSSYGIVARKSLIAKAIGIEHSLDFWRGVIDGDGSVGTKKLKERFDYPYICLCGSETMLNQFKNYVNSIFPSIDPVVHYMKDSHIYQAHINGENALKVIEHLYKDAAVYLDRKYEKAMQILHIN